MHDLKIRGGTIVDGTGEAPYVGDVAVKDGVIVDVGPSVGGEARRTIGASGRLVTPSRGEKLPIEWVVKKQTLDTAKLFGLGDRSVVRVGKKADLNVIDHERLTLYAPRMAHDLPAGGRRLLQTADGYDFTIVTGEITRENGEDTGARPGRLIRGAR